MWNGSTDEEDDDYHIRPEPLVVMPTDNKPHMLSNRPDCWCHPIYTWRFFSPHLGQPMIVHRPQDA